MENQAIFVNGYTSGNCLVYCQVACTHSPPTLPRPPFPLYCWYWRDFLRRLKMSLAGHPIAPTRGFLHPPQTSPGHRSLVLLLSPSFTTAFPGRLRATLTPGWLCIRDQGWAGEGGSACTSLSPRRRRQLPRLHIRRPQRSAASGRGKAAQQEYNNESPGHGWYVWNTNTVCSECRGMFLFSSIFYVHGFPRRILTVCIHESLLAGTCTGEHGIGVGKIDYLRKELGEEAMVAMRSIKDALDPKGVLNPGKVLPPKTPCHWGV